MFWNKTNSKRINDLATEMSHIRLQLEEIKLDLALYVKKLKASKALKPVQEELGEETETIKDSVLLPDDGKSPYLGKSKKKYKTFDDF